MWELVVVTCFGARESDWTSQQKCRETIVVRGVDTGRADGSSCTSFLERKFKIGTADYVYCREKKVEK